VSGRPVAALLYDSTGDWRARRTGSSIRDADMSAVAEQRPRPSRASRIAVKLGTRSADTQNVGNNSNFADQELSAKALERLISTLSLARSGNFSSRMAADGDGVEREVADTVNELLTWLTDYTLELERVSESVSQGELRVRLPLDKATGAWGQQLRAINNIIVTFGKHASEVRRVVKALQAGDTTRPVNVGPESTHRGGDLARLAEEFNGMIAHVGQICTEVARVFAEIGLDGRLNTQCHVGEASGSWGLLVGSVNAASASLSEQVQDLCATAQALAAGNLAARVTVASRGDLQVLKHGLNSAAADLTALCVELRRVSQEVVGEGKLSLELRHPNPHGEWQNVQDSVNRMLSAVQLSFKSVTEHAERVLEGEYSSTVELKTSGELAAPARALLKLGAQQEETHEALTALIDGRFSELRLRGETQRELTLHQLALRLKREFFRATRASVFEARERSMTSHDFAESSLGTIAQAVGATAGAYYVVTGQELVRAANLGCEANTNELPLRVGEGLPGKVARDGTPLLLDNLEEEGIKLRSGLLEFTPRALLLYPIKQDERVCAVLELLFLNDGASTAREMLEYLMADLARGPIAFAHPPDVARIRALEEELVIAEARLERLGSELQHREHARVATS
jgi:HAMP domain-containing protein